MLHKKLHKKWISTLVLLLGLAACGGGESPAPEADPSQPDAYGFTAPSEATAKANAAVGKTIPEGEQLDIEEAHRGQIASDPDLLIKRADGKILWDPKSFDFVKGDAPASVNPSGMKTSETSQSYELTRESTSAGTCCCIIVCHRAFPSWMPMNIRPLATPIATADTGGTRLSSATEAKRITRNDGMSGRAGR